MPEWPNVERRINTMTELAELKTEIAVIKNTILGLDKRINGSINDIEKHIERGSSWRLAISGVAVGLVLQVVFFAYVYGCLNRQVMVNTDRLSCIERTIYDKGRTDTPKSVRLVAVP